MEDWKQKKAGELVTFRTGKLDSNAAEEDGEFPFFTCDQQTYRINRYAFDTECALLAGNNAAGVFPLKYYSGKFNAYQRTYVIEPKDRSELSIKFFYYYLRPLLKAFETQATGVTTKFLTLKILNSFVVRFPRYERQRKIAAILTAYDDLIETNNRRIALLEKMAEELYREWFVRMRFPGHQNTRFVKGVPEGWDTKLLPELVKISYGFPFQSARFNTSGLGTPIIRIRNIPKSSTEDYTDEQADDKYLVETGDLLVGMDGEFHINHWYGDQAYLVQRVCRIKEKDPKFAGYLALAIRAPIKHFEAILACSGATVGHLGAKHLNSIRVLVPPREMDENMEFLNQLFEQKLKLSIANRKLTQTRDFLLPRLISGKLAVEDLDIQFPPSMQ